MIILYNPLSTTPGKQSLPISLLSLGAVLEGKHEWTLVDGNIVPDPAAEIVRIAQEAEASRRVRPVLGVTVMPGPQLNQAVPVTRRVKQIMPDLPVIWGGYFPTHHTDTCLKADYVDFVARGQGENTLLEWLAAMQNGQNHASIAGLSYKENSRFVHNPMPPLVSPEALPRLPYHRVDMSEYLHRTYLGERTIAYHSSFGCAFACNFCAVVKMSNQRWLAESPERMAATLRRLRETYGVDAVQFHDMDFFISEARTAEFAERIKGLGIAWWGSGRVDELLRYSDATWRKMKAGGLKMTYSGAESGSDETLKRINKGGKASTNATLELARRMREYGVVPEYSFMLGSPPDPIEDARKTIAFIRRLKDINPATEVILYTYTPVPLDGALYDAARRLGFAFPETLDEWVSDRWRSFALRRDPQTPWLGQRVRRLARNFERVLNAYYPTVTDSRLTGLKRAVLRALGAWRYHAEFYSLPLELRAFHRLFRYQRPETTGF